jgi:hypothetical protein
LEHGDRRFKANDHISRFDVNQFSGRHPRAVVAPFARAAKSLRRNQVLVTISRFFGLKFGLSNCRLAQRGTGESVNAATF